MVSFVAGQLLEGASRHSAPSDVAWDHRILSGWKILKNKKVIFHPSCVINLDLIQLRSLDI